MTIPDVYNFLQGSKQNTSSYPIIYVNNSLYLRKSAGTNWMPKKKPKSPTSARQRHPKSRPRHHPTSALTTFPPSLPSAYPFQALRRRLFTHVDLLIFACSLILKASAGSPGVPKLANHMRALSLSCPTSSRAYHTIFLCKLQAFHVFTNNQSPIERS